MRNDRVVKFVKCLDLGKLSKIAAAMAGYRLIGELLFPMFSWIAKKIKCSFLA